MADITVITPTLPGRKGMLARAQASVAVQTIPVIHDIREDVHGMGPSYVRNEGIHDARTEWVAFLDDDDELYPQHCEHLLARAKETGADLVYPWFDLNRLGTVDNLADPLSVIVEGTAITPMWQDASKLLPQLDERNWIPVTLLARTAALRAVGGFPEIQSADWPYDCCEDWGCWRRLRDHGFLFAHLPERTWVWHHTGSNTSGKPATARTLGLL